jgi:hypothetical protein
MCRYLPIGGFKPFIDDTMKLAYGSNADVLQNKQVAAVQALSGTGACRLMAEFQKRYMPNSKILIPKPTWANHHNIWRDAGVSKQEFRYYKPQTRGLDFEGMMEDLEVCCDNVVFDGSAISDRCSRVLLGYLTWRGLLCLRDIAFDFIMPHSCCLYGVGKILPPSMKSTVGTSASFFLTIIVLPSSHFDGHESLMNSQRRSMPHECVHHLMPSMEAALSVLLPCGLHACTLDLFCAGSSWRVLDLASCMRAQPHWRRPLSRTVG